MSDWLHNLPVGWMALVVFGAAYLVAGAIGAVVNGLAVGERARAFKGVSAGILSPLGILFGLYIAFTAAQVWGDIDRANAVGPDPLLRILPETSHDHSQRQYQ